MPPSLCVESVRRTLFQPWTRMSGWWFASSATSATRSTNAIAAREVGEAPVAHDRVPLAPPLAALEAGR